MSLVLVGIVTIDTDMTSNYGKDTWLGQQKREKRRCRLICILILALAVSIIVAVAIVCLVVLKI